jgi:hypothetical protein
VLVEGALGAPRVAVGDADVAARRRGDAHVEAGLILRRAELARQAEPERRGTGQRERRGTEHLPGMAERHPEHARVEASERGERAIHAARRHRVPPRRAREQSRAARRSQGDGLHVGDRHRHRQRHAKLEEVAADHALHEDHRQEYGDHGRGRGQRRERDLARAFGGRPEAVLAELAVSVNVLHHHHRVVDHQTDGE